MPREVETGIIITVSDQATKPLKKIGKAEKQTTKETGKLTKAFEKTGKATKSARDGFASMATGIYSTLEIVGMIKASMVGAVSSVIESAEDFRYENDKQLKAIADTERAFSKMKAAVGDILIPIGAGIAQAFKPSIESFRAYLEINREVIGVQIVEFLAATSTVLVSALVPALQTASTMFAGFAQIVATIPAVIGAVTQAAQQASIALSRMELANIKEVSDAELKAWQEKRARVVAARAQAKEEFGEKSTQFQHAQRMVEENIKNRRDASKKRSELLRSIQVQEEELGKMTLESNTEAQLAYAKTTKAVLAIDKANKVVKAGIGALGDSLENLIPKAVEASLAALRKTVNTSNQTDQERSDAEAKADKEAARLKALKEKREKEAARKAELLLKERIRLTKEVGTAISGAIVGGLADIISGSKRASEAFIEMGLKIIQMIAKIALEKAAMALFETAAIGGAGITTGGATLGAGILGAVGTLFQAFDSGGYVKGFAGGGGTDSVRAMLTPGEYVLPRKIVDSIRLGAAPPMASYAQGGMVAAGAGLPAPSVQVQMQTFAVPSRAQFRKWYKGSVAPNVRSMGRRGQLR